MERRTLLIVGAVLAVVAVPVAWWLVRRPPPTDPSPTPTPAASATPDPQKRAEAVQHTDRAREAFTRGQVRLAVVELKMATQIDPSYGEAWCLVTIFSLPEVNEETARKCVALAPRDNAHRATVEKLLAAGATPAPSAPPPDR